MEKIEFGYSLKNSPIPTKTEYKKILVFSNKKRYIRDEVLGYFLSEQLSMIEMKFKGLSWL